MYNKVIRKYQDLITPRAKVREGFALQALEKSKKSQPFLKRANEFSAVLEKVNSIEELLNLHEFKNEIIAAAGLSDKAARHLSEEELKVILHKVFNIIFKDNINTARKTLVSRYLLTRGDSLGGSMRNFIGASAGVRLTQFLIRALNKRKITPTVVKNKSNKITSLSWKNRHLVFDYKVKIVKKNIDLILLDTSKYGVPKVFLQPACYLAFGELKGGIDPAGADEHWKTASGALNRIRKVFKNAPLLFVGAAIEVDMAQEIFGQLQNGSLSFAANLGSDQQLTALADWLVSL